MPTSSPLEELDMGNSNKEKVNLETNTKMLALIKDLELFVKSTSSNKAEW
jgi:hypothetical protein